MLGETSRRNKLLRQSGLKVSRVQFPKPGSEISSGRNAWGAIRVLGNGHNAPILRFLDYDLDGQRH